jgi:chromosome segregation ATPase
MSEERLEKVETTVTGLRGDVSGLREDFAGLKQDFAGLKQDFAGLKQDFGGLKEEFGGLKEEFGGLREDFGKLGGQMRALHEDTIDKIKALAPDFDPLRREFRAADAELADQLDKRIVPLEAFARQQVKGRAGKR